MFPPEPPDPPEDPGRRRLHALVDRILDADPADPGPALTEAIRARTTVTNALDGAIAGVMSAWEASGDWRADMSQTPSSWLASNTGCHRSAAHRLRRVGGYVARTSELAKAAETGVLSLAHLLALGAARKDEVAEVYDRDIARLVTEAEHMTIEALEVRLKAWYYAALEELARNQPDDPPIPPEEADRLSLTRTFGNRTVLDGELGPESGAIIDGAIDAIVDHWYRTGHIDPTTDTRSRAEINAAALIHLATHGPHLGSTDGAPRPLLIATADLDTLFNRAGTPEHERMERRADIIRGGPVADATVKRLLQDAELATVLTDTMTGEPLYVGRTSRHATRGQKRGILARSNGTCEMHGCTTPHRRAHTHHIKDWDPDGLTDIDNLVDLCPFHHTQLHKGAFTIQHGPTGLVFTAANGQIIDPPYRS